MHVRSYIDNVYYVYYVDYVDYVGCVMRFMPWLSLYLFISMRIVVGTISRAGSYSVE